MKENNNKKKTFLFLVCDIFLYCSFQRGSEKKNRHEIGEKNKNTKNVEKFRVILVIAIRFILP